MSSTWIIADGRQLSLQQYAALYSLLGITYGGDARTVFNLPNLQGAMVIGVGTQSGTINSYKVGQTGGQTGVVLNPSQVANHYHSLTVQLTGSAGSLSGTASVSGIVVNSTLSGLSATATLTSQPFTAPAAGLILNGSSGGTMTNLPNNASLGTGAIAWYGSSAPGVAMAGGSISGKPSGNLSGTASVTVSGAPAVGVQGTLNVGVKGGLSYTVNGATQAAGQTTPAALPTLPSYLAMTYYIAADYAYYPIFD